MQAHHETRHRDATLCGGGRDLDVPPVVVAVGIGIGALQRVTPQVEQLGYAQGDEGVSPDVETLCALFGKHQLPIANPR